MKCAALLVSLVWPLSEFGATDEPHVDAQHVVSTWIRLAESVRTFHIRIEGNKFKSTASVIAGGTPVDEESADTVMPRKVEFWFTRDGNRERYYRSSLGPSRTGLVPIEFTRVNHAGVSRELVPGRTGYPALNEVDEFKIMSSNGISDYELNGLRRLLNLTPTGEPYFDGLKFQWLPDSDTVIESQRCSVLENTTGRGVRIWMEREGPFRIRRIETGFIEEERFGHDEYEFGYDGPAASTDEFSMPNAVSVHRYLSRSRLSVVVNSKITEFELNPQIKEAMFELIAPPGALVVDDTKIPYELFLQLADGSRQALGRHELGRHFFRLSSAVPGSRVEGRATLDKPSSPIYWIIAANVVAICIFLTGYTVVARRHKKPVASNNAKGATL